MFQDFTCSQCQGGFIEQLSDRLVCLSTEYVRMRVMVEWNEEVPLRKSFSRRIVFIIIIIIILIIVIISKLQEEKCAKYEVVNLDA